MDNIGNGVLLSKNHLFQVVLESAWVCQCSQIGGLYCSKIYLGMKETYNLKLFLQMILN